MDIDKIAEIYFALFEQFKLIFAFLILFAVAISVYHLKSTKNERILIKRFEFLLDLHPNALYIEHTTNNDVYTVKYENTQIDYQFNGKIPHPII